MSVIDCGYLPTEKAEFPPELTLLIIRKAGAFEEQALDQFTKDARRALSKGEWRHDESSGRCVCRRLARTIWISVVFQHLPYRNGRTGSLSESLLLPDRRVASIAMPARPAAR
jgi:hypothetical protein